MHVVGQHAGEHLQDLVADLVAEQVVDLLEVVDVAHHQGQGYAARLRIGQLPLQAGVEIAPVAERGQGIAHPHLLRLGQVRAQLLDLRLRLLEALLQLAGLVLHLGIGGEQELDDDADLVGRGERRQVLARLRQRDGVALAGLEIGAHQVEDGRGLAVELQGRGLERGLWHGGRRRLPARAPAGRARR